MDHLDEASTINESDIDQVRDVLSSLDTSSEAVQRVLVRSFVQSGCKDPAILRLYLDANLDINATDDDGDTVLMLAARGVDQKLNTENESPVEVPLSPHCLENVANLIKLKVNVNVANNAGETALFQAVDYGGSVAITQLLLKANCNVHISDEDGTTPLHIAAGRGQLEIVRLLIKAKSDVRSKTKEGTTALHLACGNGHADVVNELLYHKPDLNCLNEERHTPLILAAINGSHVIVQELLKNGADVTIKDKTEMTALHQAVYHGASLPVIQTLVEAKSDIESKCSDAYSSDPIINDAVAQSNVTVVEYLLKQGVKIDVSNNEGFTPLIVATQFKRLDVMELLLKHGATLEAADKNGCTALMESILKKNAQGTELLLKYGADLQSRNKNGFSAISLAMYQDIGLGKRLYSSYRKSTNPIKRSSPTSHMKQTSTVSQYLHIGDFVYLSLIDGMVLGCDGFVRTLLRENKLDSEWEDNVFCIHPKLSYDHVDLSVVDHPYFQITDSFSEQGRELKRNSLKLSQSLKARELVRDSTVVQLFHVKSQQYLRMNAMSPSDQANVQI
ncbi:Aste57867_8376 [Aphanomyces stellatus]|uniref:Aste57867_8376 protein n=1 Tax=Aphanomyces stellatus TaxID=120398 RepID=A0A485KK43_9STRA|nr:hypothetical protein As57867_008344 [Aphanomyces stellatus]VFT85262.1 Aste57867_8376 [Aphanomyces stellatus]